MYIFKIFFRTLPFLNDMHFKIYIFKDLRRIMHYYPSIKENISSLFDIYYDNLQKMGDKITKNKWKQKQKWKNALKIYKFIFVLNEESIINNYNI